YIVAFFFSSRRRHTRFSRDWSSDVCSSDLEGTSRQPDYELLLCPGSVIAEVKQIDPNETDLSPEVLRQCQEQGYGLAPVDRVRRSEERRVGKERRTRWRQYHQTENVGSKTT